MTMEEKLEQTEAERSSFHKRVVACSEQLYAMRKRAEKAERERDVLREKLTEAEQQRDDAQAFYEGQSTKSADLQESLHVAKAKLAEAEREKDEGLKRIAELEEQRREAVHKFKTADGGRIAAVNRIAWELEGELAKKDARIEALEAMCANVLDDLAQIGHIVFGGGPVIGVKTAYDRGERHWYATTINVIKACRDALASNTAGAAFLEIVKAAEAQTLAADKLETAQKAPRKAGWDTADNTTYIQSIDRHKERCRLTEEAVRRKRGE